MTPTDTPSPRPAHHHDDHLYSDSELHNEDVAHEHSDVNVRALMVFAVGLAAVVVVCAVAMWGLFGVLERQAAANDPVLSPLARPAGQLPPEPRLLIDEPLNLEQVRTEQLEAIEGIDAAKKQLLQQGLPVRAEAPTDTWIGTHSPARGESSGGRGIPLRPGSGGAAGSAPAPSPPQPPAAPPKSGGH